MRGGLPSSMTQPIWYPSPNFNAQAAHLLLGMMVMFACASLNPRLLNRCLIAFVIVMFFKEFVVDILIELDTYAESLKDFVFCSGGALLAYFLVKGRVRWDS